MAFLLVAAALWAGPANGHDCGFTLTDNNTLIADSDIAAICLGPCPANAAQEAGTVGLYVADGKQIKIGDNIYVETIGQEVQWYSQDAAKIKTRIMTCYEQTCTVGNYIPESFDLFDKGIYAVGNAATGTNTRGAWQIHSTLNMLGEGAYLHQVSCIADSGVQGWAVEVVGSAWYVMTTVGTLFIGDVGLDQILNAAYADPKPGVVSENAVLIDSIVPSLPNVGTINLPVTNKNYIRQTFYRQNATETRNCWSYKMMDLAVVNYEYVPMGTGGSEAATCIEMIPDLVYLHAACDAVDCVDNCNYIKIPACTAGTDGILHATRYSSLSKCQDNHDDGVLVKIWLGTCSNVVNPDDNNKHIGSVRFECFDTMP